MFDHFVWSVIAVPPLIVVVAWLLADRLPPGPAAAMLTWSAVGAAAASTVNLALFAVKAAAEVPVIAAHFNWSHQTVLRDTAQVPWVSWLSLAMLGYCAVAVARRRAHQRQALRQLSLFARDTHTQQVVIVTDPVADAYSIPGSPGRIVVTTGMRDSLTEAQYAALLAHEQAHLTQRHHRLIRLAELAGAAHPALRWVTKQVDYLVERAADEQAATQIGSRRTVAHAIGQAALARRGAPIAADGLHIAARAGVIPRRVGELLRPRSAGFAPLLQSLPALLAGASIIWTGEAAYDLHELLTAARISTR